MNLSLGGHVTIVTLAMSEWTKDIMHKNPTMVVRVILVEQGDILQTLASPDVIDRCLVVGQVNHRGVSLGVFTTGSHSLNDVVNTPLNNTNLPIHVLRQV